MRLGSNGKVVVITGKLLMQLSFGFGVFDSSSKLKPVNRCEHGHWQGGRTRHEQERGKSDHSVPKSGQGKGGS